MPSQRSSKRSLPSQPDFVDETYSRLPQRQDVDDDDLLEPAISTTPSSSQVTFIGGPRHKSQGIDATWFGLTIPPGVGLKKEWVKNEWMNPIPKRMGLTRRRYGKGLVERNLLPEGFRGRERGVAVSPGRIYELFDTVFLALTAVVFEYSWKLGGGLKQRFLFYLLRSLVVWRGSYYVSESQDLDAQT